MPDNRTIHVIAATVFAAAIFGFGCAYGQTDMSTMSAPQSGDGVEATRPTDVDIWPTVGTTVRMDHDHGTVPWQMRQVQVEPGAYRELVRTGAYPDGAVLAATFYSVTLDNTSTPPLYAADKAVGFVTEVIDRKHPDGRRFYVFAPGAATAKPLPAGNSCAACHNAQGSLDGTFAQHYPTIARFGAK